MKTLEEPRFKQRLHFLLWDRPSFVLAHKQNYSYVAVSKARNKRIEYSRDAIEYLLVTNVLRYRLLAQMHSSLNFAQSGK